MSKQTILESFYDLFHNKGAAQTKIIDNKNFTYRNILSVFNKVLPDGPIKILDYGCGVGTLALYFGGRGDTVVGVDVSPKAIQLARKSVKMINLDKRVRFYTVREWESLNRKNQFDAVVSIEVIEHVANDTGLLKQLRSYLKTGGLLILSTPSSNAPLYKLGLTARFDKDVGHLRRYSISGLSEKIETSGYKIISVDKYEGILRNSLFLFPALGLFIRFLKGPLSDLATLIDNLTVNLFGESDLFVIAEK